MTEPMRHPETDRILVVGGGVAGLAVALRLAPLPVTLIVAARLGYSAATFLAQGGIAAALADDDHPGLHALDTIQAGAGLTDARVAATVADAAPNCIAWLEAQGVPFDRSGGAGSAFLLGLEAAHSRRRIVHADGDQTGQRVLETLIGAARATPSIAIRENLCVTDLALDDEGRVSGAFCATGEGQGRDRLILIPARSVILATGGIGGLFAHTTNPLSAVGGGIAIAARAGAVLRDLELIQFHPTAIAAGVDPMPLATEALRGEGAILINDSGERFMEAVPGAELAPRDVVARAVFAQIAAGRSVNLDAREALGNRFCTLFPGVSALCRKAGINPARQPIPVRPAAHYHMGGILTDKRGRSTVEGLWACGEVASTGLHGANRLASNSLVEALAFADWIAADLKSSPRPTSSRSSSTLQSLPQPPRRVNDGRTTLDGIRNLMDRNVGVLRDAAGLDRAVLSLQTTMAEEIASAERRDAALVAYLIAVAARQRQESRGAHQRTDFAEPSPGSAQHTELTLAQALVLAGTDSVAPLPTRRVA